jgi:hypothetical protein
LAPLALLFDEFGLLFLLSFAVVRFGDWDGLLASFAVEPSLAFTSSTAWHFSSVPFRKGGVFAWFSELKVSGMDGVWIAVFVACNVSCLSTVWAISSVSGPFLFGTTDIPLESISQIG